MPRTTESTIILSENGYVYLPEDYHGSVHLENILREMNVTEYNFFTDMHLLHNALDKYLQYAKKQKVRKNEFITFIQRYHRVLSEFLNEYTTFRSTHRLTSESETSLILALYNEDEFFENYSRHLERMTNYFNEFSGIKVSDAKISKLNTYITEETRAIKTSKNKNLTFKDYLAKPFQRVMKHPLLLKDLSKNIETISINYKNGDITVEINKIKLDKFTELSKASCERINENTRKIEFANNCNKILSSTASEIISQLLLFTENRENTIELIPYGLSPAKNDEMKNLSLLMTIILKKFLPTTVNDGQKRPETTATNDNSPSRSSTPPTPASLDNTDDSKGSEYRSIAIPFKSITGIEQGNIDFNKINIGALHQYDHEITNSVAIDHQDIPYTKVVLRILLLLSQNTDLSDRIKASLELACIIQENFQHIYCSVINHEKQPEKMNKSESLYQLSLMAVRMIDESKEPTLGKIETYNTFQKIYQKSVKNHMDPASITDLEDRYTKTQTRLVDEWIQQAMAILEKENTFNGKIDVYGQLQKTFQTFALVPETVSHHKNIFSGIQKILLDEWAEQINSISTPELDPSTFTNTLAELKNTLEKQPVTGQSRDDVLHRSKLLYESLKKYIEDNRIRIEQLVTRISNLSQYYETIENIITSTNTPTEIHIADSNPLDKTMQKWESYQEEVRLLQDEQPRLDATINTKKNIREQYDQLEVLLNSIESFRKTLESQKILTKDPLQLNPPEKKETPNQGSPQSTDMPPNDRCFSSINEKIPTNNDKDRYIKSILLTTEDKIASGYIYKNITMLNIGFDDVDRIFCRIAKFIDNKDNEITLTQAQKNKIKDNHIVFQQEILETRNDTMHNLKYATLIGLIFGILPGLILLAVWLYKYSTYLEGRVIVSPKIYDLCHKNRPQHNKSAEDTTKTITQSLLNQSGLPRKSHVDNNTIIAFPEQYNTLKLFKNPVTPNQKLDDELTQYRKQSTQTAMRKGF